MPKATTVNNAVNTVSTSTKRKVKVAAEVVLPAAIPEPLQATIEATLQTLEHDTMGPSWYGALKGELTKDYFLKVERVSFFCSVAKVDFSFS